MKRILIGILSLGTPQALADIPAPIIEECNVQNSGAYHNMPWCLETGAVGYDMLEIVQQDELYGPQVQKVIEGCQVENERTAATWACVLSAARRAVEIRELIGPENMQDACYRMLSDPETLEKVHAKYREIQEAYLGFSDLDLPLWHDEFSGCPEEVSANGSAAQQSEGDESKESDDGLSEEACTAFGEIETALASHTLEELEAIDKNFSQAPKNAKLEGLKEIGMSDVSIAYFESLKESKNNSGIGLLLLLGAILNKHHPDFLTKHRDSQENLGNTDANQIADSVIQGLLGLALEGYEKRCSS